VRLQLLVGDVERANILGFFGELIINPGSSHCVPTDGSVFGIEIYK
jgi:hypothetical protein